MTSKKWVRLFLSTLALGGIAELITSFFVKSGTYANVFQPFHFIDFLGVLLWFIGMGFIFSLISQMGFFAYLTVHQFGMGMFKTLWTPVQVVLIGLTLFDLVYFRYQDADIANPSLFPYIVVALVIFIFGLIVAYVKVKDTNKLAFIPALFFMVVITTAEWVPALRVNEQDWLLLMVVPLLACNTYQLLLLTHINKGNKAPEKSEAVTKKSNKKKKKKKRK